MSGNAPTEAAGSDELRAIQTNFQWLILLQVVVIVGLVILFMQIGGVPDKTAQQIPSDTSGNFIESDLGPIGTNITDLQAQVAAMAAEIDAICTVVVKSEPAAASPNPCTAP